MLTEVTGDYLDLQCRGESPTSIGEDFSIARVRLLMKGLIRVRGLSDIQQFVQGKLNTTLNGIDNNRINAPHTMDHNMFYGYANLSALELLDLIRDYERKNNLRDKEIDLSRFSPIEIHELERLYNYVNSIGRGVLYNGMMDITKNNSKTTLIEKSELISSNIKFYISYMRAILIRYYKQMQYDAESNLDATRDLMERIQDDKRPSLILAIHAFTESGTLATKRLHTLHNTPLID